jgi:UDP-GlcNAc:undecaprenyl-phosphate GlcNAc-1-phosphate transferase
VTGDQRNINLDSSQRSAVAGHRSGILKMQTIVLTLILLGINAILAIWVTVPFSGWLAHRVGAMDQPGKYKIHSRPTPRLGGLGIILAFAGTIAGLLSLATISGTVYRHVIILLALMPGIALLGFVDDLRGLKEWIKFLSEGLIALIFIALVSIEFGWLAILAWFWIVGLINGYNFLDGMDGLASGVATIHLLTLTLMFLIVGNGILALVAGLLAVATVSFLRYNWPPAQIFMGDIGSLSLGFAIASLSLLVVINENFALEAMLAVALAAGLPVGDVALTFLRRLVNGKPLFPADRGHFYDQMIDKGKLPKSKILRLSLITSAAIGSLSIVAFVLPTPLAIGSFILAGGLLLAAAWYFKISLRWETS